MNEIKLTILKNFFIGFAAAGLGHITALIFLWGTAIPEPTFRFFLVAVIPLSLLYATTLSAIEKIGKLPRQNSFTTLLLIGVSPLIGVTVAFTIAYLTGESRILMILSALIIFWTYVVLKIETLRWKLSATFVVLFLCFMGMEAFLTYIYDPYDFEKQYEGEDRAIRLNREILYKHPELDYLYIPNSKLLISDFKDAEGSTYSIQVKNNSLGLRDNEFSKEKTPDTLRIIVVGDSLIWGLGVDNENTIPKELEKALLESSHLAEVWNWGIGGYNLRQELALMQYLDITAYQPDLVLLAIYLNDFEQSVDYNYYDEETGLLATSNTQQRIREAKKEVDYNGFRHTHVYRFFRKKWENLNRADTSSEAPTGDYLYSPTQDEKLMATVHDQLNAILAYAEENDLNLAFMLIPTEITLGESPNPHRYGVYEFFTEQLNTRDLIWFDTYPVLNEETTRLEHRLYLPDDVSHLTAEGNRIVGQAAADFILRENLISGSDN